ncbi:MAG: hypothetical protein QF582_17260 [Alphaproteobacteria bacterium]|jgi:hypothetical protein|nr:hypothetical protein [Alphaproteobacteria bacterium]
MTRRLIIAGLCVLALVSGASLLLFVPNPLGGKLISAAKAQGYIAYTPDEAITLAYQRCSTCHSENKMLLYCSRCGPPFVVVAHFMRRYVEITNRANNGITVEPFTDAELAAITQVWNGLIGNWESDWPRQDLKKLLAGDEPLIRLLQTAPADRPIEAALRHRSAPGSYKEETNTTAPRS